ncbi:sulfite exporter TauE/SafE family protein [Spongiibacter sp. KMU-158]|uniref:Probable membrane transporter protein n=1 Tax=Spongiibacter pelagi TaxID=2760804 RepID=A0A927BYT1_9GAMM|nr:sulfite exporter TauE/SafE family protein [Spongiibacter pelagi]MBD2857529.1 sulfite exporter TauE/SafE family protein [Spongiibacter pelagi]
MTDLALWQYLGIGLIFIWSGFVRSGLGFGGAVLSLPFLLLIYNEPLVFLPLISVHLLFFSALTIYLNNRKRLSLNSRRKGGHEVPAESTVDWPYLRKILAIMIVPKMIGVFGLITLPPTILSPIIFTIVSVYALGYIFNRPFRSNSKVIDTLFLVMGGYISGTSLIGAPLIIAVASQHIAPHRLRDTMFALWFILVSIKMVAFMWVGVDLQLIHHLWLLPCAAIGHVIGLRAHQKMLAAETPVFLRVVGSVLLIVSAMGIWSNLAQ